MFLRHWVRISGQNTRLMVFANLVGFIAEAHNLSYSYSFFCHENDKWKISWSYQITLTLRGTLKLHQSAPRTSRGMLYIISLSNIGFLPLIASCCVLSCVLASCSSHILWRRHSELKYKMIQFHSLFTEFFKQEFDNQTDSR